MTEKELLYITTIAEMKSISKAVAVLGVNQSSLSRCIRKIESQYSIKLFYKNKNLLLPTAAGENYIETARKILERYDKLKKELANPLETPAGDLNIGTGVRQAQTFLPYLLPELKTLYPHIKINLTEAQTIKLNRLLESGELDMVISPLPLENPHLEFSPLFREKFLLVAPPGKVRKTQIYYKKGQTEPYIHLKTLNDQPFILGYHHQYSRVICDEIFKKAGFIPIIGQLTRSMENARRLCATGLGYAIMPESSAKTTHHLFTTEHYNLDEKLSPYWTMAAIYQTRDELPKAAQVFLQLLAENAKTMQTEQPVR